MTAEEVYTNFLIKANKNDTNKNVAVPKGLFVKIYNEQSKLWLRDQLINKTSTDTKNDIAEFLILDRSLTKKEDKNNYSSFELPNDYFDYGSSYTLASKNTCKNRVLINWDFKIKDRNTLIQDSNNNPSFEYQETLINFSEDNINVFKTDFFVDSEFLSYYKSPDIIDIGGYVKEDGTDSQTINPTTSDYNINKILNWCVLETIRIFENPDGYNLAKDRLSKQ